MTEEKSPIYKLKIEAVYKMFESALSLVSDREMKIKIVTGVMDYLNKKYLGGGYFLDLSNFNFDKCSKYYSGSKEENEIAKNQLNLLWKVMAFYQAYYKGQNYGFPSNNRKVDELLGNLSEQESNLVDFIAQIDEIYLKGDYYNLVVADATNKSREELKAEMVAKGLDNILPLNLPDMVEYYLEEIIEILCTKCYEMAKEKGFHSDAEKETDPQNMINAVAKHGMNLIGEVIEWWEAARKGKLDEPCDKSPELNNRDEEMADWMIRGFDTAKTFGVRLGRAMRLKWEINKKRPHRNGGKLA